MVLLVVVPQQTLLVKWKYKVTTKTTLRQAVVILPLVPLKYIFLNCGETTPMTTEANPKNTKGKQTCNVHL